MSQGFVKAPILGELKNIERGIASGDFKSIRSNCAILSFFVLAGNGVISQKVSSLNCSLGASSVLLGSNANSTITSRG